MGDIRRKLETKFGFHINPVNSVDLEGSTGNLEICIIRCMGYILSYFAAADVYSLTCRFFLHVETKKSTCSIQE